MPRVLSGKPDAAFFRQRHRPRGRPDGSRYADLDNAFVYRKKLVAGCTCNGRDPFGLARVDVNTDPTLRPGDIVATKTGLVAVTAIENKVAIHADRQRPRRRQELARETGRACKIMPPSRAGATPVTMSGRARADDNRSAQLSR